MLKLKGVSTFITSPVNLSGLSKRSRSLILFNNAAALSEERLGESTAKKVREYFEEREASRGVFDEGEFVKLSESDFDSVEGAKLAFRALLSKSISEAKEQKAESLHIHPLNIETRHLNILFAEANHQNFRFDAEGVGSFVIPRIELHVENQEANAEFLSEISEARNFGRTLCNLRPDRCTPFYFVNLVEEFAKENKLNFTIFRDEELKAEGLNLIYTVGHGSVNRPAFAVVEYRGRPDEETSIALVGKGVTFDAGGINIKPSGSMEDMFLDKSGACAAFAAFRSAVKLNLPVNLVLAVPLAENFVSSTSYRPSDIILSHSKKLVEITNTDAEGRLILADAISYVQQKFNLKELVEISTLTGAAMIALGPSYGAVYSNKTELTQRLQNAGQNTGDLLWPMPFSKAIEKRIKSGLAEVVNSSRNRIGGSIEGAEFIKKFVKPELPWAHIDIAGVMSESASWALASKEFGTGFGSALLLDFIKNSA